MNLRGVLLSMSWFYLFIAGLFEVVWAIGLKYTEGFTKIIPTIITIIGMVLSFYLLSQAIKELPIGTAYAVWTGVGALGTVIVGMVFLGEPHHMSRLFFVFLIIVGMIGLKFTSAS